MNDDTNEKGEIPGSDLIFTRCVRIFIKEVEAESDSTIQHVTKKGIGNVIVKLLKQRVKQLQCSILYRTKGNSPASNYIARLLNTVNWSY